MIREELEEQRRSNFKRNIYHWTQVIFAYHSNKIEGGYLKNRLKWFFDTHFFISKTEEVIQMDDLTETINHFQLFDYMLDYIDESISKSMSIEMNKVLKRNTSDEANPRYKVDGFKTVPNIIGLINVIRTTSP